MALIAPGVTRYSVLGKLQGQDIVNVFDYRIDTTSTTTSREEANFRLAGVIINAWAGNILQAVSDQYSVTEVRWVDLSSASGGTGSRTNTDDETLPRPGTNSGGVLPNNVCALVVKNLANKTRTARNGLTRVAGVPEAFTVPAAGNNLTADAVTGYGEALNGFLSDTTSDDSTILGYGSIMVVVHTVNGAFDSISDVDSFTAKSIVGTIRRRMPGYGT